MVGGRKEWRDGELCIGLLTAGRDKPYALGLASALVSLGISLDFIGSDSVDGPELHNSSLVNFLNLRDQRENAGLLSKGVCILCYYGRLARYAAKARPTIFHILWNNKFELLDRTILMLYYRSLGKRIVLTAHNVNAGKRDLNDSFLNRISLRMQYRLCDHIFVHTARMKRELASEFSVRESKISVVPFGINNTVPNTELTPFDAKEKLGIDKEDRTLLFFGNIAPYKGLELVVDALAQVLQKCAGYRLIVAGRPKGCESYWNKIRATMESKGVRSRVIERIQYIPDEETELYFKAADVLVLPYGHVFQSGVLFLGYSFGLPVIAADVGSLRDEIIEGKTGFVFRPGDASDLAEKIEAYFSSDLYLKLDESRREIQRLSNERNSWAKVAEITRNVYASLFQQ